MDERTLLPGMKVSPNHFADSAKVTSTNLFDSDEEDSETETKMAPTWVTKPVEKLEVHWRTLEALMTSKITEPSLISDLQRKMFDIADIVVEEESELSSQLSLPEDQITPCLEYLLNIDALQSLVECTQREQEYSVQLKDAVMKFIVQLISLSKQPLLIHNQLLRPLLRLLESSRSIELKEYAATVVSLVFLIWSCIERDSTLITLFEEGSGSGQPRPSSGFPLVDLLMDHIHLDGDVGEWTRGAFLAILRVCAMPAGKGVGEYLEKSVFCQVRCACSVGVFMCEVCVCLHTFVCMCMCVWMCLYVLADALWKEVLMEHCVLVH